MYNKVDSIEEESKKNNRIRPIYIIIFILNLLFLSITYAYLAISVEKKVNGPKGVSPGHEEETTTIPSIVNTTIPNTNPVTWPTQPNNYPVTTTKATTKAASQTTTKKTTTKKTTISTTEIPPTPIEQPNWRIIFENIQLNSGSVEGANEPTIDSYKTSITYEAQLSAPGEYYSFDVDIVNKGNIDAKIYSIIEQGLTDTQKRYLEYKVTYKNGTTISKNDTLLAGERKKITVYLKFKDEDITKEDLPTSGDLIKLKYQIVYVEK